MSLELSEHLRRQAARRGIDDALVRAVAEAPAQIVPLRPGREVRQSRVSFPPADDVYLVRVFVDVAARDRNRGDGLPHEKDRQVLKDDMKVNYDAGTDILTVVLRDALVAESDEDKPGVILDYDEQGNLVSIEVLDASTRVEDPRSITLTA